MVGNNVYFIANVRLCRFAASPAVVLTEDSILSDLPAIRSAKITPPLGKAPTRVQTDNHHGRGYTDYA